MEFEDQLKALILYHLEEHSSGRHLIQVLKMGKSPLFFLIASYFYDPFGAKARANGLAGFFAIIDMLSKTGFGALMILFLDITTENWYDLLPE